MTASSNKPKEIVSSHHMGPVDIKDQPLATLAGKNTAIVLAGRMIATYDDKNIYVVQIPIANPGEATLATYACESKESKMAEIYNKVLREKGLVEASPLFIMTDGLPEEESRPPVVIKSIQAMLMNEVENFTTDLVSMGPTCSQFIRCFGTYRADSSEGPKPDGFQILNCIANTITLVATHHFAFAGKLAYSPQNEGLVAARSRLKANCVLMYDLAARKQHQIKFDDETYPFNVERCDFINAELLAVTGKLYKGRGSSESSVRFFRIIMAADNLSITQVSRIDNVGRLVLSPKGDYCAEIKEPKGFEQHASLLLRKIMPNGLGEPKLIIDQLPYVWETIFTEMGNITIQTQAPPCEPVFSSTGLLYFYHNGLILRHDPNNEAAMEIVAGLEGDVEKPSRLFPLREGLFLQHRLYQQPREQGQEVVLQIHGPIFTCYQLRTEMEKIREVRSSATYQNYIGLFRQVMGFSEDVSHLTLQYVEDPEILVTKLAQM